MTPGAESVISCANDQAVWPWQAEPYRLWSLLDMRIVDVSILTNGAGNISIASGQASAIGAIRVAVQQAVDQVVASIQSDLAKRNVHVNVIHNAAQDVENAMRAVMRGRIMETVEAAEQQLKGIALPLR